MHSPIIYLVQESKEKTDIFKENNYELYEEELPCEEYMDDSLVESDWHQINTIGDITWHRGDWSMEDIFSNHLHFDFEKTENVNRLKITKKNLIAWDDALNYYLERYVKASKRKLLNNEIFQPIHDLDSDDYFAIQDMLSQSYGGIAFVLYKQYDNELEIYDVFKEKDLIEYCKREMFHEEQNEIAFNICKNAAGDYHY